MKFFRKGGIGIQFTILYMGLGLPSAWNGITQTKWEEVALLPVLMLMG